MSKAKAMVKRHRIRDLEEYADHVAAEVREKDWVSRHAYLTLYTRDRAMFMNLTERLSPDEWLHGCRTGERASGEHAIPLHEYRAARSWIEKRKKQFNSTEFVL